MAISRYPGNQATWTQDISIAPPGSLAAPLFDLYPSLGDVTIASATNLTTTQDGPSKVWRFGALTVNALLSFTKRARPQFILCDSLVMGVGGGMSMTARGAAGASNWPIVNLTIPQSVALSANKISQRNVLQYIKENGIWIGDPVFWALPDAGVADCRAVVTPGSVTLLSAAGCGARKAGPICGSTSAASLIEGYTGNAGSNGGTGGGGTGGCGAYQTVSHGGAGSAGYPFGGGSGGGGAGVSSGVGTDGGDYGGAGGNRGGDYAGAGAGNPAGTGTTSYSTITAAGDGTGGVLLIICRGDISIASGCIVQADGMNGAGVIGAGYTPGIGGGGSGGGHVSIIYSGTLSNSGTIRANGGAAGSASGGNLAGPGGPGGAGSVVTKTFAQMGWT